ncbi:MAG: type I-B CRISPR-associated protein Cas7/Cst2/DevR [Thermodesulfobacterium sp.]|nr:type I-B CRISPR-associated protein Cas7/Cst2/DevR [Thermodesulfobacterium sp.]
MRKIVIGLLTRVSGNVNANEIEGDRIRIKKLVSIDGETYPFVSARAVKRGIREKFVEWGFEVDQFRIGEGEKLADSGDPIKYVDNDLFGYLYIKGNRQRPRVSPISMSPIIAVKHTPIEIDFGGRFPKEIGETNPTPFEIEVADFIGLMKVVITERCGIFTESEKTDQIKKWDEYVKENKVQKETRNKALYVLEDEERIKRVTAFLEILFNEGWAYPRRANYFAMAEHFSAIVYCGEKLYPVWKNFDENYQFTQPNILIEDREKLFGPYNLKIASVLKEDIEKMATWLVTGQWKK